MKGMKRVLLMVMMAGVMSSECFAMTWVHLGSDGQTTHFFYKPKTFSAKSGGQIVSAWTKKEYNVNPDMAAKNKVAADDIQGNKSTVAFQEFNCSEHKMRTLAGKTYEGNDDADVRRTDWLPVATGTVDESLLNALCKESAASDTK